jgi:hypothetical protein
MFTWLHSGFLAFAAAMILSSSVIAGEPGISESKLRDELLRHFGQDNLLPVFLPRDHAVGDVLQPDGRFFARQAVCFPALKVMAPKPANSLTSIVVDVRAEGNFGIGLKKLVDVFARAGATSASKITISFTDQVFSGATSLDLQKHYAVKACPALENVVANRLVSVADGNKPLLVLQEVYYARKRVSIEVSKGMDVQATFKEVRGVVQPLGLQAELAAGTRSVAALTI